LGVPLRTLGKGDWFPHTLFMRALSSCLLSNREILSWCSAWICCILATSVCRRHVSLLLLEETLALARVVINDGVKDWL
jgi:hypothetical protein